MKQNIFESAYFGKAYKTRDGRKAILVGLEYPMHFVIEGITDSIPYLPQGDAETKTITHFIPWLELELRGCGDIVSEWQNSIREEDLNRLALEYINDNYGYNYTNAIDLPNHLKQDYECYKASYRQSEREVL